MICNNLTWESKLPSEYHIQDNINNTISTINFDELLRRQEYIHPSQIYNHISYNYFANIFKVKILAK